MVDFIQISTCSIWAGVAWQYNEVVPDGIMTQSPFIYHDQNLNWKHWRAVRRLWTHL